MFHSINVLIASATSGGSDRLMVSWNRQEQQQKES